MKKLLLVAAFAVFAFTTAQSQVMKAGVSVALPVGDASDISDFGAQLDFAYLFEINEAFQVGPMASFFFYNGKDYEKTVRIGSYNFSTEKVKGESFLFLPIGGSARYIIEDFFFGADLGYGIGLSPSGNDGGFFYRPKVGYNFGSLGAVLSYSGISRDGGTFSSVNAGVEFSF